MSIFIAESGANISGVVDGIVFTPSGESWDDFGNRSLIYFYFIRDKEVVFEGVTKVLDIKEPEVSFAEKLVKLVGRGDVKLKDAQFVSAMPRLQSYRKIIESLGRHQAGKVLRLLKDAPYANINSSKPAWLRRAEKIPAMYEVLLRHSESHFAYHNLRGLLAVSGEQFSLASEALDFDVQLKGFSNKHCFKFRWDASSLVPRKVNVIVGENGVGKSQGLKAIAKGLVGASENLKDVNRGGRVSFSRLILLGATGADYSIRSGRSAIPCFSVPMPKQLERHCAELVGRLLRDEGSIADRSRLQIAADGLADVFLKDEVCIKMAGGELLNLHALQAKFKAGREQERLHLVHDVANGKLVQGEYKGRFSSGHIQFIWMVLNLCAYVENGSLVLIDEPEAHLHPALISQFVALLNYVLRYTGSFAIAATHSAYLVREVPADCVVVLRKEMGRIIVGKPRLQTFGADIGSISCFVFQDELVARMLADVAEAIVVSGNEDSYLKDVSISARIALVSAIEGRE